MAVKTPIKTNAGNAKIVHPLYAQMVDTWVKAHDVHEGLGGFLAEEKPYLVAFPREWLDHSVKGSSDAPAWVPNPSPMVPSPKLKTRRKLARYENVESVILDTLKDALFQQPAQRVWKDDSENPQVTDWFDNVDGRGTTLDGFIEESWTAAAVFGHAVIYAEKDTEPAATEADVQGPRLCRSTPLDVIDWLLDDYGNLIAVKFIEPIPRESFDDKAKQGMYIRTVDDTEWVLYDENGAVKDRADHGFGKLPVVVLYGKRRIFTPVIGAPVVGDPQLYLDIYNLTSEVREILRNQTFGILNIPVGVEGSVEREQEMIGMQSGTANALFSSNAAQYSSPAPENVANYHEHIRLLTRLIYRLANVPWESDSLAAETAESRKIKRADMQAALDKYAGELQKADDAIVELGYRALYGDTGWEARKESDGLSVSYPETFELPDPEVIVARAEAVIGLELGETATKTVKKRTARVVLPNMAEEQLQQVDAEIDAAEVLTADERQDKLLEASANRMSGSKPFGKVA